MELFALHHAVCLLASKNPSAAPSGPWDVFVRASTNNEVVDSPLLADLEGTARVDLLFSSGTYRGRSEWERIAAKLSKYLGASAPEDIQDYADQLNAGSIRTCDCPELLGYASIGECKDTLGEVDEADRECIANVLEGSETEAQEFLACATTAANDYADCVAANTGCEMAVLDQCSIARDAAMDACTGLSSELRVAVAVCTA